MSFFPLFAPSSGTDQKWLPEHDWSAYDIMLEDCLQDSKAFNMLAWNTYEEKKDSVIKVRSQVQKIQNTLISTPTEEGMVLMIQTLYYYRDLELIIVKNLASVLAYKVISSESSIKNLDSELSSIKFLLKDKENLIGKMEKRAREKESIILDLEKKIHSKKKAASDSDTDVEEDVSWKKKANNGFIISDRDVLKLASILQSLDPSLPHPTPSNLISSLSKLQSGNSSTYSNVEKDKYKDKYEALEAKYSSKQGEVEKYREEAKKWKHRFEDSRSRKNSHNNETNGDKINYNEKYQALEEKYTSKQEELEKYQEEAKKWKRRYEESDAKKSQNNDPSQNQSNDLKELKATLRREAEQEISSISEQADREMKEMQESFNLRLRETETGSRKQIDDLKKKLDTQEREIRTLKLESTESLRKNQSVANSQMDKLQIELERQYQDHIDELENKLEQSGLEASKTLEKELEKLREAHEMELSSLSRRHKKDLEKAQHDGIIAKIDTQNLLDEAHSTIERIKEEAFKEKEETDREFESLTRKINHLTDENHNLSLSVQQVDTKYIRQIEQLESQVSILESENSNLRGMVDIEKGNSDTLKQDIRDKETYISELGKSVLEYQKLMKEFEEVENRYKAELQKKNEHIASLEGTIQKEKESSNQGLLAQLEAKDEALDQLDRIKRRLEATEQDLKRAKSFTDEKETEIIDLKKLIRSQNKQLETALGGPVASTPKHSKDDLESKVEVLNTQISSLKRQLEYKEKESFEVRMEAAEAFQKASDLDKAKEEINRLNSEMDKISLMLIELKSAKVQLLERVDNAEHRENLLKNELSLLKAELERKR